MQYYVSIGLRHIIIRLLYVIYKKILAPTDKKLEQVIKKMLKQKKKTTIIEHTFHVSSFTHAS